MKNIVIVLSTILACNACSKDDSPVVVPNETIKEVVPTAFSIQTDPSQVINNLQVGNRLAYDVKIKNFDTNPNIVYVLKPVVSNATKHQLKGTDFNLQSQEVNDAYVNRDSIIIKNTNSKIYIHILRPGTFQHEYTLQKMEAKKKINPEAKEPVLFNAVKINIAARPAYIAGSNWLRYFEFSIDDGELLYDNYLTTNSGKSHTFVSLYEEIQKYGAFTTHTTYVFKDALHSFDYFPAVNTFIINEIKVTQELTTGGINIIQYKNLIFNNQ